MGKVLCECATCCKTSPDGRLVAASVREAHRKAQDRQQVSAGSGSRTAYARPAPTASHSVRAAALRRLQPPSPEQLSDEPINVDGPPSPDPPELSEATPSSRLPPAVEFQTDSHRPLQHSNVNGLALSDPSAGPESTLPYPQLSPSHSHHPLQPHMVLEGHSTASTPNQEEFNNDLDSPPPLADPWEDLDEDDLDWTHELEGAEDILGRRDALETLLAQVQTSRSPSGEGDLTRVTIAWPRAFQRPTRTPVAPPSHPTPAQVYTTCHPLWFGRLILITVAFLHFTFHLPFSACNLLLSVMSIIFLARHDTNESTRLPTTLATVIKRLDLEDRFAVVPSCPQCHKLFIDPIPNPSEFACPRCNIPIFHSPARSISEEVQEILGSKRRSEERHVPKAMVPIRRPSDLVAEFLDQDGMEAKMDDWRLQDRNQDGLLRDIMDGRVWKELKDPLGGAFFGEDGGNEVRIGLTVHLDWFDFTRSANSPSHSTGVVSLCIANLDATEHYQTKNLLVPLITPGPKEPNAEQLLEYLDFIADDLLSFYEDGIILKSGRTARAAVVVVICDHPAMCKFGGFADKNHENAPCTRCVIRLRELFSEKAMRGEFSPRRADDFRQRAHEWKNLPSAAKREEHFKAHGVRAFAFAKLPYFDPIRMMVIDPMHNLLLGLVKAQWYGVWIKQTAALRANTKKKNRELHDVHTLLAQVEVPSWMGRLPSQIGEPAGGSLSADEWKTLALTVGPLILPIVFEDWRAEADREHTRNLGKNPETTQQARMVEGEMENFLLLSAALSVLLARTIRVDRLEQAQRRLTSYLVKFRELYGEGAVKPNHHWATHLSDQILDYGPVYGFWAFLQERLNYTMKNFKTNNRSGGGLEVTLMRSFEALTRLRRLLLFLASFDRVENTSPPETETVPEIIKQLLADRSIARGTVEVTAARQAQLDAKEASLVCGTRSILEVTEPIYSNLITYFNSVPELRNQPVYSQQDATVLRVLRLSPRFATFSYIVVEGRRMVPAAAQRAGSQPTIIAAHVPRSDPSVRVAELLQVLQPLQSPLPTEPLAIVRWLKPSNECPLEQNVWEPHQETLGLGIWLYNQYDHDLPSVITCSSILAPVARVAVRAQKGSSARVWLTISLDKHGTNL